jgi:hypothetical protein
VIWKPAPQHSESKIDLAFEEFVYLSTRSEPDEMQMRVPGRTPPELNDGSRRTPEPSPVPHVGRAAVLA